MLSPAALAAFCVLLAMTAEAQVSARRPPAPGPCPDPLPTIEALSPPEVGVTGQLLLRGEQLGEASSAVVLLDSAVVATDVEHHQPTEVVVRVPFGAVRGVVEVVTCVDGERARELQARLDLAAGGDPVIVGELAAELAATLAAGRRSSPWSVQIVAPFVDLPAVPDPFVPAPDDEGGAEFVRSQVLVDLHAWPLPPGMLELPGFAAAEEVADALQARLAGYLPATSTFVLELDEPAADFDQLDARALDAAQHPAVAGAWLDIALRPERQAVADVDMTARYRRNEDPALAGRTDAWATDRIQAPGAWNLVWRFLSQSYLNLNPIKVALMDTGVDHAHPDWVGVNLVELDASHQEVPYTSGDPDPGQHGTGVGSLIAAVNDNVVDPATGDRGINGLVHDDFLLTVQVHRASIPAPGGFTGSAARYMYNLQRAAGSGARVMNVSMGNPVNPATPAPGATVVPRSVLRVQDGLLRMGNQLRRLEQRILLVVSSSNSGQELAEHDLVPGWFDGQGWPLSKGYHICGSLGHLPNVISVGSIGGPPVPGGWALDDQRVPSSGFGSPVTLYAPGADVLCAGGDPADPTSLSIGGALYSRNTGTSYAAPLVAGTAALVAVIDRSLKPADIKQLLLDTALPVTTTDGYGNVVTVSTLKTGYAVRRAMIGRGIFQDDDPWTGVSKVVTGPREPYDEDVLLFEVRRGADGRAEGFAPRGLLAPGRQVPVLRHDGRTLACYHRTPGFPAEFTLREYTFVTGAEATLVGPLHETAPFPNGQWLGGNSFTLEYSPRDELLWYQGTRPTDCGWEHVLRVLDPAGLSQDVVEFTHNGCSFQLSPPFDPLDWESWAPNRVAWRPDSRRFDLGYDFLAGTGASIQEECADPSNGVPQVWYRDIDYALGQPPLQPLPGCPGAGGPPGGNPQAGPERVAWSPDGRARIATTDELVDRVHTRYYDPAGNELIARERPELVDLRWTHWSPDGSEAAFVQSELDPTQSFTSFMTLRRDLRALADRDVRGFLHLPGRRAWTFSWQW